MPKLLPAPAREELWRRGVLSWKFHAAQKKIDAAYKEVSHYRFVANCSRRLGKTYWACTKAIETALTCELPFPRIVYASATKVELKKFAIPSFEAILADCPEEIRPVWKASEDTFIFPHNGARIELVGLDKRPDGGRGNACDLYVFEEAGMIRNLRYLSASVVQPVTITREGARVIMISTPSITPAHEFQSYCETAKAHNSYAEFTIYDNPMLSEDAIEKIKEETFEDGGESTWLREYMCQHVVDENLAIIPEWRDRYERAPKRPDYFPHLHLYVGMDLGTKVDFTAMVYGYWDPIKQRLVIEDEQEIMGPQMTTPALVKMIQDKEAKLWPGRKVYRRIADNDNPLLVQDMGILHGMHFVPTGKDELHAMINEVRILVKADKLIVHPRCEKLVGCLRYGIFTNEKRKSFDRNKHYGHFDHLAALIYLVPVTR